MSLLLLLPLLLSLSTVTVLLLFYIYISYRYRHRLYCWRHRYYLFSIESQLICRKKVARLLLQLGGRYVRIFRCFLSSLGILVPLVGLSRFRFGIPIVNVHKVRIEVIIYRLINYFWNFSLISSKRDTRLRFIRRKARDKWIIIDCETWESSVISSCSILHFATTAKQIVWDFRSFGHSFSHFSLSRRTRNLR